MSDLSRMACLTPGITDTAEACLAESIQLRGARTAGGPASTSATLAALDALLLAGPRRRCVQHRCAVCGRSHVACALQCCELPMPLSP